MPHLEDESQLSEKERIRRAEQRLLPSQPPGAEAPSASGSQPATAPHLPDEMPNGHGHTSAPEALLTPPAYASASALANGTPNGVLPSHYATMIPLPTTPVSEQEGQDALPSPISSPTPTPQTNSMQAFPSAPPTDDAAAGAEAPAAARPAPTAPTIEDDELYTNSDEHDSHADASARADLPRYER